MNKHSLKLAFMFSLMVFVVLSITMIILGSLVMILYKHGIIHPQSKEMFLFTFTVASTVLGTVISRVVGKRIISSIVEITDATKEVAKGNFNITLNEKNRAYEIRTMAKNFNIMTREISNTEMLRNDFVNNVSHEFKTPLTAIEGYATLLQNKNLDPLKRDIYVEKIICNTKRLSTLTGNILRLSRLDNQEISIEKKSYSLDEQLRQIILANESDWTLKELELDIDLDTVEFLGNSELLEQVWQNLIGNAIKFLSKGDCLCVILREYPEFVKVIVKDNGIGMTEDEQKRIFEKFYQGDTSHSTVGNGLGLTLAKTIINLHGGEINVSSKKGEGTSFNVILPKI